MVPYLESSVYSPKSQDFADHEAWCDPPVSSLSEALEAQPQSCTHHSSESTVQSLHICNIQKTLAAAYYNKPINGYKQTLLWSMITKSSQDSCRVKTSSVIRCLVREIEISNLGLVVFEKKNVAGSYISMDYSRL